MTATLHMEVAFESRLPTAKGTLDAQEPFPTQKSNEIKYILTELRLSSVP